MANPRLSSSSGLDAISADNTLIREIKLSILTNGIRIAAIENLKEFGTIEPAKVAFSAVGAVLTKIKDTMRNKDDFIDVGVCCANICSAIERGTRGKTEANLSPSFVEAIKEFTRTVNDIQTTADKISSRTVFSRTFFSDKDKERIAGLQVDLSRLLQIFNTELNVTTTTTTTVQEILDTVAQDVKDIKDELRTAADFLICGERPPPPPPVFFGRDELVGEILNQVQNRKQIALIGAGGIGKTSIAKAVLNHSSAQKHFIAGLFFVKCDDFVLSLDRFLGRVAQVVGATISQSAPLASLRSFFLSRSHALLLVLDNVETILESMIKADFTDAIVEIGSFPMVTLLITTRTTVLPNDISWERITVSPLDVDSSREAFFWIYKHEKASSAIDPLLTEIDFHPLSISILASVATQDSLSMDELKRRWDVDKTLLLDLGSGSGKQQSLAASMQLSLNSPALQDISEDALQVLQLVALSPQGVETTTLQQLVPTVKNASQIADTLGRLFLTYRKGVTMLAPIRLYILDTRPPGPMLLDSITTFYSGNLDILDSQKTTGSIRDSTAVYDESDAQDLARPLESIREGVHHPNSDSISDSDFLRLLSESNLSSALSRLSHDRSVSLIERAMISACNEATRDKCLRMLRHICGKTGALPASCSIQEGLETVGDHALMSGGFADVWQGVYHGKTVAIKVIKHYTQGDVAKTQKRFCKEACLASFRFSMVSDWMENGKITDYLRRNPNSDRRKFVPSLCSTSCRTSSNLRQALDITHGLGYLHSMNVVHGDLKGANILVNDNFQACLADFGLATVARDVQDFTATTSTGHGSTRWMAPELFDPEEFGLKEPIRTKETDVYSLGMVILEIFTGKPPFAELRDLGVMRAVTGGTRPTFAVELGASEELWKIMEDCWQQQPTDRPPISKIIPRMESERTH